MTDLKDTKKKVIKNASKLYKEGKHTINDIEDSICEYSDELVKTIKEKPLTALLIAGGIGFLLSHLLKK
jgi:ElaB/YqjD/DUF883 family membrane-anchored ribosome-binding protein